MKKKNHLTSKSRRWWNSQCWGFSISISPHVVDLPSTLRPASFLWTFSLPTTANGVELYPKSKSIKYHQFNTCSMNCLQTDWNGRHYPVSFIDFPIVDVFVLSWRIHFNSILFQILLNPWFVLAPLLHSSANNQQSTRLVPYSTIRFRITSRVKVSALAITGITLTTPLRRLRTWRSSGRRLCPVGGMKYKQQWIRVSTMKRPRCALCSSLKYVSYWFSMYFNAGSQLFTIFNIHHSFDMKPSFPSIYQLVLSIWSPNPGVSVTLKSSLMPFSTITGTQKIMFQSLMSHQWMRCTSARCPYAGGAPHSGTFAGIVFMRKRRRPEQSVDQRRFTQSAPS